MEGDPCYDPNSDYYTYYYFLADGETWAPTAAPTDAPTGAPTIPTDALASALSPLYREINANSHTLHAIRLNLPNLSYM